MRRIATLPVVVALAVASACAPKIVPLPNPSAPRYPEFMLPAVPDPLSGAPAILNHERGWIFLQGGDLRNAEREVNMALAVTPGFYPADALGGYVELARKAPQAALTRFDRVLERESRYVPALVGKGQALMALDREGEAMAALEAAVAIDPSLGDVQRRIAVMRFRVIEQRVAAARQAAKAGNTDKAVRAYEAAIATSPESAFLYRELAAIERQREQSDLALAHFRQAVALEPTDAGSLAQIAELLEARGEREEALKTYAASLAIEPNEAVESRRERLRSRIELSTLPDEYRAIESLEQLTRGDLAALIGVRLAPLLQATSRADAGVITDMGGHWAAQWILAVVASGAMEPFANHTFQPHAAVRRVDFAETAMRLLQMIAPAGSSRAAAWENLHPAFPDLPAAHLSYGAASTSVASGVMLPAADGSFRPSAPLTGAEATVAIERVRALAGLQRQASVRP